jgi:hypothetical protein
MFGGDFNAALTEESQRGVIIKNITNRIRIRRTTDVVLLISILSLIDQYDTVNGIFP